MIFEYLCGKCNSIVEGDYKVGKAAKTMKCDKCGNLCERYYGNACTNFILKGGGWHKKQIKMDREMTAKNEKAGRKMRKEHVAPKLIDQR